MVDNKLISLRIPNEVEGRIQVLLKKHPYFKRSTIINRILLAVLTCASEDALWHILATHDPFGDGLTLSAHVKEIGKF